MLNIKSRNIINGYLDEKFGGYSPNLKENELPHLSFEIEWTPVYGAKSYALELIDFEASNVVGFPFIHWIVSDIKTTHLAENSSLENKEIIQGVNSTTPNGIVPDAFKAKSVIEASQYMGPYPPDRDHTYTIRVYALNIESLKLSSGFYLGDMHRAMKNHIIEIEEFQFMYKKAL